MSSVVEQVSLWCHMERSGARASMIPRMYSIRVERLDDDEIRVHSFEGDE